MAGLKNKSKAYKFIACCIISAILSVLVMFSVHYINSYFMLVTFVLGASYGVLIEFFMCSNIELEAVKTRGLGFLSVFVSEFMLSLFGIQQAIILWLLRNVEFVQETGRLSLNERLGFGFARIFFWQALLFLL